MVLVELIEFSKLALSIAIWCYVYFLLRRTEEHEERRPWEYLYVGCMALFLFELIAFLQLFRANQFDKAFFIHVQSVVELAFLGFLLFAFLSQHHMLARDKLIIISSARPKESIGEEKHERREDREEVLTERAETEAEVSEDAMITRELQETVPLSVDPDPEREKVLSTARHVVAESEKLLQNAAGADPIKVGLFQDQLEDLKVSLQNPACSTAELKRKIMTVMHDS